MPERFKVVHIPCKALYKCSAFFTANDDMKCIDFQKNKLFDIFLAIKKKQRTLDKLQKADIT